MEDYNPFNSTNTEITLNDVQSILKKYGLSCPINKLSLFKRAFIHKSYTTSAICDYQVLTPNDGCVPLSKKSNERLEFLGDGVLELITKYYLYKRFPNENEGFMT
jgi:dsRNA-specific ribonuclease